MVQDRQQALSVPRHLVRSAPSALFSLSLSLPRALFSRPTSLGPFSAVPGPLFPPRKPPPRRKPRQPRATPEAKLSTISICPPLRSDAFPFSLAGTFKRLLFRSPCIPRAFSELSHQPVFGEKISYYGNRKSLLGRVRSCRSTLPRIAGSSSVCRHVEIVVPSTR